MLDTCRLASYVPKGKEKQAMKQQKAMLIALIVICLTVIVTALVTRKDLCEVRIRTGQTEVAIFTAYEPEEQETRRGRNPSPPLMWQASSTHPHLTRFGGFLFLFSTRLKFWTVPE